MNSKQYQRLIEFRRFFFAVAEKDTRSRNMHFAEARRHLDKHERNIYKADIMANKKTSKKTRRFEFKGYVNIAVPQSHENKIQDHISDAQAVYEELNTLLVDGYSLKIYYDDDSTNYRASLTCMSAEDSNYGYVLGSYAQDWFTALAVLTYKHFDISKESWSRYTQDTKKGFG